MICDVCGDEKPEFEDSSICEDCLEDENERQADVHDSWREGFFDAVDTDLDPDEVAE